MSESFLRFVPRDAADRPLYADIQEMALRTGAADFDRVDGSWLKYRLRAEQSSWPASDHRNMREIPFTIAVPTNEVWGSNPAPKLYRGKYLEVHAGESYRINVPVALCMLVRGPAPPWSKVEFLDGDDTHWSPRNLVWREAPAQRTSFSIVDATTAEFQKWLGTLEGPVEFYDDKRQALYLVRIDPRPREAAVVVVDTSHPATAKITRFRSGGVLSPGRTSLGVAVGRNFVVPLPDLALAVWQGRSVERGEPMRRGTLLNNDVGDLSKTNVVDSGSIEAPQPKRPRPTLAALMSDAELESWGF